MRVSGRSFGAPFHAPLGSRTLSSLLLAADYAVRGRFYLAFRRFPRILRIDRRPAEDKSQDTYPLPLAPLSTYVYMLTVTLRSCFDALPAHNDGYKITFSAPRSHAIYTYARNWICRFPSLGIRVRPDGRGRAPHLLPTDDASPDSPALVPSSLAIAWDIAFARSNMHAAGGSLSGRMAWAAHQEVGGRDERASHDDPLSRFEYGVPREKTRPGPVFTSLCFPPSSTFVSPCLGIGNDLYEEYSGTDSVVLLV
ncbi:unnamed protein product [Peniophora sp. CBMAI 1063]|nr:unnamed protein product [Peniophora sp. CBMAI 1063]